MQTVRVQCDVTCTAIFLTRGVKSRLQQGPIHGTRKFHETSRTLILVGWRVCREIMQYAGGRGLGMGVGAGPRNHVMVDGRSMGAAWSWQISRWLFVDYTQYY